MFSVSVALLSLLAQDAQVSSHSGEAKTRAQFFLKEGARHYERAEFADALESFQKAYDVFPSPKLLFNIGQASRDLGRPVEAIEAFEKFLAQAHGAPEPLIAEAKQSLDELSPQVGRFLVECALSGSEIKVDGKTIGLSPIKDLVRVVPGGHQLTATHEGASPAIKNASVAAGTIEAVVLRPRALADAAASEDPSPVANEALMVSRAPEPAQAAPRGWFLGRTWTWVAAGSALAFAGGATVAGLMMQSKFNQLDKSCGSSAGTSYTGCSASDLSALDTRKNTANVLWGLSAAATVTAGVLFYVEGRPVSVSPTAGQVIGLAASARY